MRDLLINEDKNKISIQFPSIFFPYDEQKRESYIFGGISSWMLTFAPDHIYWLNKYIFLFFFSPIGLALN